MSFDEVRLPENVERGAQGGPGFKTSIIELSSGFEQRNIDWSQARLSWDIGYGISYLDDANALIQLRDVITFFYARKGRAYGFRFKDWTDYEVTTGFLGTGDGSTTQFQALKRYTSGSRSHDRELFKLVSGTQRVFLDGIETGDFSVDVNTGIYTMNSAPALDVVLTHTTQFDVPVRFDVDQLEISIETFQAGEIPRIPVKEVRIPSSLP